MLQVCSDFVTRQRAATAPAQTCHTHVLRRHTRPPTVVGMSTDLRHRLGRAGEDIALRHLQRRGYELVSRNHRTRFGEIDLVVRGRETLVFCEVKTRRAGPGSPWDALGPAKQGQVRAMARAYLAERGDRCYTATIRFDAIGVVIDARGRLVRLDHIEGAF